MAKQQGGRGCGCMFLGGFTAGILIFLATGVAAYFYLPKFLKDADKKIVPWLESKGRVLVGKMTLKPLIKTIERSELSESEKKEWKEFLTVKWELASTSQDQKLRREVLINASREVVGSDSGIYYALLAIGDCDFKKTSLTARQIDKGQKLITGVTANMLDGVYANDELKSVKANLYSVLTGWRIDAKNEQGRREQDKNLRDFFRALQRLYQKTGHKGDNRIRDMRTDFQKELLSFRNKILQEESNMTEKSEQTDAEGPPTVGPRS